MNDERVYFSAEVARHEAGHCVAALALDIGVDAVEVHDSEVTHVLDDMLVASNGTTFYGPAASIVKDATSARRRAITAVAGDLAGGAGFCPDSSDASEARKLIRRYNLDALDIFEQAARIVQENADAIEKLADALWLRRKEGKPARLEGREILEIVTVPRFDVGPPPLAAASPPPAPKPKPAKKPKRTLDERIGEIMSVPANLRNAGERERLARLRQRRLHAALRGG